MTFEGTILQITAGDVGRYLEITAWITALFILLGLAVAVAILRYHGIDRDQRRQLYAIRPQLLDATPKRVTVERGEWFSAVKPRVRRYFTGEEPDPSDVTVREAAYTLGRTVRSGMPTVPKLAVRGAAEGAVILAIGLALWVGSAWVQWLVEPDATIPGTELFLWLAQWLPATDFVLAMGLLVVILGWDLLSSAWLALGVLLIAGAALLTYVDNETEEDLSVTLFPDRRRVFERCGLAVAAVLLTAMIPNAVLTTAGFATAGSVLAGLASLSVLIGAVGYGLVALANAVVDRQSLPDSNTRAVAAYLLIRKSFAVLAVVALPVMVWMVGRGLIAGFYWLLSAPLVAIVTVVLVLVATSAAVAYVARDEAMWLLKVTNRWLRSASVRGWLFARGIPATAMILAFLVAWVFGLTMAVGPVPVLDRFIGLFPALFFAIAVGAVVRGMTLLWSKAKYQFVDFDDSDGARSVVLGLFPPIEDANGELLYVARVEDHELAHREIDALVADIETVISAEFAGEGVPVTESRYYWKDIEFGTVDLEEVRRELRGDVRSRMLATIKRKDGVDYEVIDDQLVEKYPEAYVEHAKASELARGDISRQDGQYVYHG